MFFSVGRTSDSRFDLCYRAAGWHVNVDAGWSTVNLANKLILFKGYCDQFPMLQAVENLCTQFELTGNFCIISIDQTGVDLSHSCPRPFPLWTGNQQVTNFSPSDQLLTPVWADTQVHIDNNGTICFLKKSNPLPFTQLSTLEQVVDYTVELLQSRAHQFRQHQSLPVQIYRTGGVDTCLVDALCNNTEIETLNIDSPSVPTMFVKKNQATLKHFWAYQQLHYWEHFSCIATGAYGDELFLRGPDAIAMIAAWHNIDFLNLLSQHPTCYHYHYFNRLSNRNKFLLHYQNRSHLKEQYPTWQNLCLQILNMLANDHQHWHIGKTMTWTPLKEISIAQHCLTLPIESLLDNFLDATITKMCIKKLDSTVLDSVDQFKNLQS